MDREETKRTNQMKESVITESHIGHATVNRPAYDYCGGCPRLQGMTISRNQWRGMAIVGWILVVMTVGVLLLRTSGA